MPNPFFAPALYRQILEAPDDEGCGALLDLLAENETWQVPTLTVLRSFGRYEPGWLSDPRLEYIPQATRSGWEAMGKVFLGSSGADPEANAAFYRRQVEVVGLASRHGVPLLAGTDTPNPFVYPGFSLHDELELLVEAGLSPLAALQASTLNPARYLGATDSLGTVEPGKVADLVLLRANPLERIDHTREIEAVIANGLLFDRDRLDRLLSDASAAAEVSPVTQ